MNPSTYLAIMFALLLTACGEVVLRDLPERDVNEMLAHVASEGIKAWKRDEGKGRFSLRVARGETARAVTVLDAAGLPRRNFHGMEQALGQRGLISSPTEEGARLVHALSQELSESLSMIDGVLGARVHLVVPEVPPFSDRARVSSASILIRYRESYDVPQLAGRIKLFVQKSVENLDYDAISVVFIPARELSARSATAPAGRGGSLWWLGALALVALLAAWWRHPNGRPALLRQLAARQTSQTQGKE